MTGTLTAGIFEDALRRAESICILGHTGPDGDCAGSCLGTYNYILNMFKEDTCQDGTAQREVNIFLDNLNEKFAYLPGYGSVKGAADDKHYGLAVILDCASPDRLGKFRKLYEKAGSSVLIDHHASNTGFADYALIDGDASSACEVLYTIMDQRYFDLKTAECIYTGLVHDTGVFRYSCTHRSTMEIAGKCMEMGVDFGNIIDDSYFAMSFARKKLLGYILCNMQSMLDGRLVYSYLDIGTRCRAGGADIDLDGMIDNMRSTKGALAAVFMYETADGRVKASLRSNSDEVDVSIIAGAFGGGGHKRAAGCFVGKGSDNSINKICGMLKAQLGI